MSRFVQGLRCPRCLTQRAEGEGGTDFACTACGHWTEIAYDLAGLRGALDRDAVARRPARLWRWRELLPVRDAENEITLGEGGTPLLPSRRIGPALGLARLYFKDLGRGPTASFKDYSASVSVSRAREIGAAGIVLMSAGNASAAFAAYCAVAGLPFLALMLPVSYPPVVAQNQVYGARAFIVDGTSAAAGEVAQRVASARGWMNAGVPANPYRVEGKKVIAYEIALDLGWRVPDRIVCPTAGGTSMMALAKGFAELEALGWAQGAPKLDCVQHETCAPVVTAWREHAPPRAAAAPRSIAVGLLAPDPAAASTLVGLIDRNGAAGITVDDDDIRAAQRRLAREEGLFVEPSSAAALAGLVKLVAAGTVRRDETIVLMLTGAGIKATTHLAEPVPATVAGADELLQLI